MDARGISATGDEVLGEGAVGVEDGRLSLVEVAAFVGVDGIEEVQAARRHDRRKPLMTAFVILYF